jgi:hypothetical protein
MAFLLVKTPSLYLTFNIHVFRMSGRKTASNSSYTYFLAYVPFFFFSGYVKMLMYVCICVCVCVCVEFVMEKQ